MNVKVDREGRALHVFYYEVGVYSVSFNEMWLLYFVILMKQRHMYVNLFYRYTKEQQTVSFLSLPTSREED